MPPYEPPSTEPEHIAVSKSKGIKIDWKDGHHSDYQLRYLRDNCPCATCTGTHSDEPPHPRASSPFQMYESPLKITAVEALGSYAMQIAWSDGHKSGIYSYNHLREICPCGECR